MRRLGVVFALAAGLLSLIASVFPAKGLGGTPQESAPVTEFEYWALVEHSRQIAAGQSGLPAARVSENLKQLAEQWTAVRAVRLANGQTAPLDHSYLITALRADPPDLARIKGLFEALQTAHGQYPAQVFSADELAVLEKLAMRPEFQWRPETQNPIQRWLQEMWGRFLRWLEELFGQPGEIGAGTAPASQPFLMVLTTAMLVLVLLYVARTLLQDFVGDSRLLPDAAGAEVLTADLAFNRAMELSRGRDYRSAVRYLYLSSLLLLDERGLLRYDRSRTNREYLRSLADQPALAKPLGEVIDVFDSVWYGYHELDEETFKHYSRQVEALKDREQ